MTVSQHDRGDIVLVLVKEGEVWNRNVNAISGLFRETHSRIENNHLVGIAQGHTIHPKLADTAERDNLKDTAHCALLLDSPGNWRKAFKGQKYNTRARPICVCLVVTQPTKP